MNLSDLYESIRHLDPQPPKDLPEWDDAAIERLMDAIEAEDEKDEWKGVI